MKYLLYPWLHLTKKITLSPPHTPSPTSLNWQKKNPLFPNLSLCSPSTRLPRPLSALSLFSLLPRPLLIDKKKNLVSRPLSSSHNLSLCLSVSLNWHKKKLVPRFTLSTPCSLFLPYITTRTTTFSPPTQSCSVSSKSSSLLITRPLNLCLHRIFPSHRRCSFNNHQALLPFSFVCLSQVQLETHNVDHAITIVDDTFSLPCSNLIWIPTTAAHCATVHLPLI